MSTNGRRDFRPTLRYTPEKGWINDPNGLVYADGKWHLFAQFYPHDTKWGPMHWAHAISGDLLHWEHLPIAIEPDAELGMIFSGSAVYDRENTSGFGTAEQPPIVAMFTHHGKTEQQSIAYSTDGVHFTKYAGNPVIANVELKDFRDPKVFRNPVRNCWSVVLAAGDRLHFYASENLREWTKTGEFGPEGNHSEGVWECPDIFPLELNGETHWVLMISMGGNRANHGSRTQYFIGSFDGDRFIADGRFDTVEFVDAGFDNYAAVTFAGAPERVMVGWNSNWEYAWATPTGEFCGCMTVPRVLSLVDTPKGGIRLAQRPLSDKLFGEGAPCDGMLTSEVFKLTVSGEGAATVKLSNSVGQELRFGINEQNELFFDRTDAGAKDFHENFADEWYSKISAPRLCDGAWVIEFTFDRSACELYLDGGTRVMTNVVYPDEPYTRVSIEGDAKVSAAFM